MLIVAAREDLARLSAGAELCSGIPDRMLHSGIADGAYRVTVARWPTPASVRGIADSCSELRGNRTDGRPPDVPFEASAHVSCA